MSRQLGLRGADTEGSQLQPSLISQLRGMEINTSLLYQFQKTTSLLANTGNVGVASDKEEGRYQPILRDQSVVRKVAGVVGTDVVGH